MAGRWVLSWREPFNNMKKVGKNISLFSQWLQTLVGKSVGIPRNSAEFRSFFWVYFSDLLSNPDRKVLPRHFFNIPESIPAINFPIFFRGKLFPTGFHPVWITVWHFYVGLVLKQGSTNFLHTFRAGRASFFRNLFSPFFFVTSHHILQKKIHRPLFFSCASVSR